MKGTWLTSLLESLEGREFGVIYSHRNQDIGCCGLPEHNFVGHLKFSSGVQSEPFKDVGNVDIIAALSSFTSIMWLGSR
jgi:hypothetical protein